MDAHHKFGLCTQGIRLAGTALKCAVAAWFGWCLKDAIVAFAGRESTGLLIIEFLGSLRADVKVAYLVGALGGGFGVLQMFRARFVIRRYAGRAERWEGKIDVERSSSKLSRTGDTRLEDR